MSIAVFWISSPGIPFVAHYGDAELSLALSKCEELRKEGMQHVCISSQYSDNVGKAGVSDKLPEGYNWKKRRI